MKRARAEGEHAKVGIRNARKEANDYLKEAKADGLPEDAVKVGETKVQDLTDAYIRKVDEVLAAKEADVMTV
jgi:ribosome recycling factor